MAESPLIGVTGPDRGGVFAWWFTRWAVHRAGGRALRMTPERGLPTKRLDGLIIGGGADVDPSLYGEEPRVELAGDHARDRYELGLLEEAEHSGLPLLGICRGAQLINIYHEGTLYQDIREVDDSLLYLRTVFPRKPVDIVAGSRLRTLVDDDDVWINSLHTQCIREAGKGLTVVARDHDQLVQGVEMRDHPFLVGVQWHPEYLPQLSTHQGLFRGLVQAASGG